MLFQETVRVEIYRHFIANGRPPSACELASVLRCDVADVEGAYAGLSSAREIALNGTKDGIWMAHPFSAVATPYRVEARGISYWANCAWDALGIAAVLGSDTAAFARCPDCEERIDLSVREGQVADPAAVIHFAIPPSRFWENIGFT